MSEYFDAADVALAVEAKEEIHNTCRHIANRRTAMMRVYVTPPQAAGYEAWVIRELADGRLIVSHCETREERVVESCIVKALPPVRCVGCEE